MIVISDELALSADYQATADNPLIGYRNFATIANLSASTAEATSPVSNLANPSTYLKWIATQFVDDEVITVSTPDGADCDYVAIAGHNFGTIRATVSLEGAISSDGGGPIYDQDLGETTPAHDGPLMFVFASRNLLAVRLRIEYAVDATVPARAAVLYAGEALMLQRKIYAGHTPMPMGRVSDVVNGRSESGQFLGRIVLATKVATSVELKHMTPSWVRASLNPFLEAAVETPFFFAWRPGEYPDEIGFGWLSEDAQPVNDMPNGFMSANLSIDGVA